MDFDAPLGVVWPGYLNPHYRKCPACDAGIDASRRAFETIVRRLLIAGYDSTRRPAGYVPSGRGTMIPNYPGAPREHYGRWPHPYLLEMEVLDPGDTLHQLTTGLAGRAPSHPFGHDSCDTWRAQKAIIAAAGLDPETWGICKVCQGHAIDPAVREAYEAWEPTEHPTGPGYQLWSTTSEGSPVSPVFATADELAAWCEVNATTFASFRATKAEWLTMFGEDFVRAEVGNAVFI